MPDVLIRNLDERTLAALKAEAAARNRSLQKELQSILHGAAERIDRQHTRLEFARQADAILQRLEATGLNFGDSADDVRRMRDGRSVLE
jgi:plasmid stability protein